MNPIIAGLAIILFVSLTGNAWLFSTVTAQSEELGQVHEQVESARGLAKACSDGVDDLRRKSDEQVAKAKAVIAAAHKSSISAGRRADAERSRPQAVPGNACASAEVETRDWLAKRREK